MTHKDPTIWTELARALAAPVLSVQQSDDRVYLPYLSAALVLGGFVWAAKLRGRVTISRFLFPREIWLHPSALFDLRFMVARAVLTALLLGPIVVSSAHVATTLSLRLTQIAVSPISLPDSLGFVLITASAFVGDDFARYVMHRAMHRVPALWELHKVHHSAEVLTPFTIYRTHPVEGLLNSTVASIGLGTGAAVTAWLLGTGLTVWEVLGVHGLSFAWNITGSNLRHSHVWLSYPRWLQRILISPAQHQIHHSDRPEHFDRNFGAAFACWDWMFGSLFLTGKREKLTFGLAANERNHEERVLSALFAPLLAATLRLFRRSASAAP